MEVFAGDLQIPNPDGFTQLIAPFPEPTDLIYDPPTAVIHSPDVINHRPVSPPQKLRPIRFNARSRAGEFRDNAEFVGTLGDGFLSSQAGCFEGEFECEVKIEGSEAPTSAVRDNDSAAASDPIQFGSGTFVEGWETNGVERGLDNHSRFFSVLSSSSDDGVDFLAKNFKGPRKRQRKSLEHFLESLVMKVMEKQEEMHKQLIEMIEKMEKERVTREEAWKKMERERQKRDEVVRTKDISRNLALISFLQNFLGEEEIQIPVPGARQSEEENGVETDSEPDNKQDTNDKIRWPEAEVQALIALRTALERKFRVSSSKGSLWEEISVDMGKMGYNRTAKKCREKWENIKKYFESLTGSGKKRSPNGHKTCQYFHDLEFLYRNGLVNPGVGVSIARNGDDDRSERDSESL